MPSEQLQMLCLPHLFSRSAFNEQSQNYNPAMMGKNSGDFLEVGSGELDVFLPACQGSGWRGWRGRRVGLPNLCSPSKAQNPVKLIFIPHQNNLFDSSTLSHSLSPTLCVPVSRPFPDVYPTSHSTSHLVHKSMGIPSLIHKVPHVTFPEKHNLFPFSSCITHMLFMFNGKTKPASLNLL